ncbi:sterile alpha motif domain-containing protein 15-like [Liolophura sinensis]|uniref:sterile alpha motif domain-containing protein 15-like n=1 Tax=Liolophura sinensis TaxID=3198878 RepID=UPI00315829D2
MESAVADLKDGRVPSALYWSIPQVADWIDDLGFPAYRECFTTNLIDGRRLIALEASAFPKIGITDFNHIKSISKSIRELLSLEEPDWKRSISFPPREDLGMFLERKMTKGASRDAMTYKKFLLDKNPKWRPPLANMCLILPHGSPAQSSQQAVDH